MKGQSLNMKVKKKKNTRFINIFFACVLTIPILIYGAWCTYLHLQFSPEENYFGKQTYREIFQITSLPDRKIALSLMGQIDDAFAFIGASKISESSFGALSNFSTDTNNFPQATCEEHHIKLISASFNDDQGYLWFAYFNRVYNESHMLLAGAGTPQQMVLVRLCLVNTNGQWKVTDFREHP